ncbi:hypothetical protein [Saccharopolyspora elongata]|uniref:Uncharacterized protein n=1 Tax=Saccharopolyspora elongata TaxID=2530387 RepID=A0A4R4XY44_9PSEU|nr:hypothetical protein [Saccharopolyspora elongata]TDD36771.1 hypothetical protein E1288_41475 [Saccharopolyspora elongata]
MRALTNDIPFGPFEGTDIEVYIGGKSKTARIHVDRSCIPNSRTATMPLNAETVNRMCKQCARSTRWARRDTALGMFLQAIASIPEDSQGNLDDDYPPAECARAAELLRTGEYPLDEDDDDLWEKFSEARELRDSLYSSWRYARRAARDAHAAVAAYPWLGSWAAPRLSAVEAEAESLRALIAQTIGPERLVIAAAAMSLVEPELPADRLEFSVLGNSHDVHRVLNKCWRRWCDAAAGGCTAAEMASQAMYVVDSALGRKRNGRDAAMAATKELIGDWTNQIYSVADLDEPVVHRDVVVQAHDPGREDNDPWEMLTRWELAVVVRYATAFSWAHDAVLLTVPDLVARHLLDNPNGLRAAELDSSDPLGAFTEWVATHLPTSPGVLPGTLDDTSINKRRMLTSSDVDRLRRSGASVYQVYSASDGTEVLHISTLAERCANGWRGVVLAGPNDLPSAIIEPWIDEIQAGLNDEPDPLGTRAGEQSVVNRRYGQDRFFIERRLRMLALVRTATDLRTLTERYEQSDRDIDWHGLLTPHQLDLTPFKPATNADKRVSGLGLPLEVLASVQIYTTDGTSRYQGKGHSPFCSFARSGRASLDDSFDLLHVRDLLGSGNPDWCSVCGGYATRRLDDLQLRYYRTAHELLALSRYLDRPWQLAKTRSALEKLADFDPDGCGSFCSASREWESAVHSLLSRTSTT